MKILGIILILTGLAAAAPAGIAFNEYRNGAAGHHTEIARLDGERHEFIEKRTETNLAYRATLKSIHDQPDSLRVAESGKISKRLKELDHTGRYLTLQIEERERLMRREDRFLADEAAQMKTSVTPWAGASLALLLAGVAVSVWARLRA